MDGESTVIGPRLLISRRALLHNLQLIRKQLGEGTKICAMVKADAYGHGAINVVDTLCNPIYSRQQLPLVQQVGVACLEEAASLEKCSVPILVLRTVEALSLRESGEALEHAVLNEWILTAGTCKAIDDLACISSRLKKQAKIHVMVDTGMTRCGCAAGDIAKVVDRIVAHTSLKLVSLGTHFATAEFTKHSMLLEQLDRFQNVVDSLGPKAAKAVRTAANSAALFLDSRTNLDMVRPGIALYGIDPSCTPNHDRALRPVAKWTAPIISILPASPGTKVGYGQTWQASHDTRIGLVPVGYADGYLCALRNRAMMEVRGRWVPVVGRISMDLTTIDRHDVPEARVGDEVTIMDDNPLSPASVYALAGHAGTIPYEVLTRIGQRVRRTSITDTD